jgi:hypothetical protein
MIDAKGKWQIKWIDGHREPKVKPNPDYPDGVDVRAVPSNYTGPTCKYELPYPAPRCGMYAIKCETCGINATVSTAGRPDDPRSLEISCIKRVMH